MDHSRPLTAFDAQFLAAEVGNMTSNYCGLARFGTDAAGKPLTATRVKDLIASRIDRIPALRWRLRQTPLGLDHPSFEDGPVDLDAHVIATTLAAPGGERELGQAIGDVIAERLDRDRPLWRFHVIDGLADGRVAVGMVFHHAAADALGAAMLMGLLMDPDPAGRHDLPGVVEPREPPSTSQMLRRTAARSATHPVRAVQAGLNALPYLDQVPMMRALPGARTVARAARRAEPLIGRSRREHGEYLKAPKVRFNGPLSPGRSIAFTSIDVQLVKDLKDAHGVSFNDVVVAAVGGGLRRRLQATGVLPEEPLLAFVPSSVRTAQDDGTISNAISSFVAPVPTHLADAKDRMIAAHEGMALVKERHEVAPVTLLEDANALIPPIVFAPMAGALLRLIGTGVFAPPLNLVLSNVPGPPMRLHLDGAPMQSIAPLSLVFDGVTLNVTVVSYAGVLEIGLVGDSELVPDAWELVADITAEFEELHAAL